MMSCCSIGHAFLIIVFYYKILMNVYNLHFSFDLCSCPKFYLNIMARMSVVTLLASFTVATHVSAGKTFSILLVHD